MRNTGRVYTNTDTVAVCHQYRMDEISFSRGTEIVVLYVQICRTPIGRRNSARYRFDYCVFDELCEECHGISSLVVSFYCNRVVVVRKKIFLKNEGYLCFLTLHFFFTFRIHVF